MCRVDLTSNERSPTTKVVYSAPLASRTATIVKQEANLDRFSALVDAAAVRADDLTALFDFVLAIADLWDRLGLRDPFVDAQLGDAETRERLVRAARHPDDAPRSEHEPLAFYALRTLAALQMFVDGWRRQPSLRTASVSR